MFFFILSLSANGFTTSRFADLADLTVDFFSPFARFLGSYPNDAISASVGLILTFVFLPVTLASFLLKSLNDFLALLIPFSTLSAAVFALTSLG